MPPAINDRSRRRKRQSHQSYHQNETDGEEDALPKSPAHSHQQASSRVKKGSVAHAGATTQGGSINERLRGIPEKRSIPWRTGQELLSISLDGARPQQKSGLLLVTRGEVQNRGCAQCQAGNGRFEVCVSLKGFFGGACASCIFPSKGSMCSLRKDREEGDLAAPQGRQKQQQQRPSPEPELQDEVPEPPSRKRQRKSTLKVLENEGKKRKTTSRQSKDHASSFALQQEREEDEEPVVGDLLSAALKKHKSAAKASVSLKTLTMMPLPQLSNGGYSAHPYGLPARAGQQHEDLTAVNSDARSPPPMPNSEKPPEKALVPPESTLSRTTSSKRSENGEDGEKGKAIPLIDTFSNSQQRQVYGLLHELQDGIDHLNAQLSSLKSFLGLDETD